jgi:toxin-antitoxin system PIN domain toxin
VVILPDVNIFVFAFRREAEDHDGYATWLNEVRFGAEDLALVDPVLTGLVRVVTNARVFADPAPTLDALSFVERLRASPAARVLGSTAAAWERMRSLAEDDRHLRGNLVPDAWLAALALTTGARVATSDGGFGRFPDLEWFDPVR